MPICFDFDRGWVCNVLIGSCALRNVKPEQKHENKARNLVEPCWRSVRWSVSRCQWEVRICPVCPRCPQCSNVVRIWATVETSPVNLCKTRSIINVIEEMKSSKVMKHLTSASHRATMSTAPRKPSSHHDFCLELVRKRDRDHYLTSLLLPHKLQSLGFALRALNIQVKLKYVLLTYRSSYKQLCMESIRHFYSGSPGVLSSMHSNP